MEDMPPPVPEPWPAIGSRPQSYSERCYSPSLQWAGEGDRRQQALSLRETLRDAPTPAEDAAFDKCFKEKGMIMCLCSRVASGRVVRSPGLQKRGFVAGDNLQPWKARLLLALAITKTTNADEIQRMFDTY